MKAALSVTAASRRRMLNGAMITVMAEGDSEIWGRRFDLVSNSMKMV